MVMKKCPKCGELCEPSNQCFRCEKCHLIFLIDATKPTAEAFFEKLKSTGRGYTEQINAQLRSKEEIMWTQVETEQAALCKEFNNLIMEHTIYLSDCSYNNSRSSRCKTGEYLYHLNEVVERMKAALQFC